MKIPLTNLGFIVMTKFFTITIISLLLIVCASCSDMGKSQMTVYSTRDAEIIISEDDYNTEEGKFIVGLYKRMADSHWCDYLEDPMVLTNEFMNLQKRFDSVGGIKDANFWLGCVQDYEVPKVVIDSIIRDNSICYVYFSIEQFAGLHDARYNNISKLKIKLSKSNGRLWVDDVICIYGDSERSYKANLVEMTI